MENTDKQKQEKYPSKQSDSYYPSDGVVILVFLAIFALLGIGQAIHSHFHPYN